jgi:hypothetical protein
MIVIVPLVVFFHVIKMAKNGNCLPAGSRKRPGDVVPSLEDRSKSREEFSRPES